MTQDQGRTAPQEVHKSETSYWPIVLAGTLTLAGIGVFLNNVDSGLSMVVSAVGAVLSIAAVIGWAVERFGGPPETHEAEHGHIDHLPAPGRGQLMTTVPVDIPRSPQWWGLVWFIATEAVFFANLIAGYVYLRATSATWPPTGTPHVELLFPAVNTFILLLSGVPAWYARRAIKKGDRRGLQIGLVLAAILGAIFLAGQGYEYTTLGLALQDSVFAAGFYVLTGFHGAHVVAGIGLLLAVLVFSMRGRYSERSSFGVEVAGTYWHFVDVVWIFLFTSLYIMR